MEIKLGMGGGKQGPHSGYSGTGKPGRRSSHLDHDDPHEDEYDEETLEAADAHMRAIKSGDSRAMVRTYRTFKALEDYRGMED